MVLEMRSEHLVQVRNACNARDLARVRQLFAQYSLNADDATKALRDAPVERSLYRFLLESGANANIIHIRQVAWSGDAGEILKMLQAHQYDFRVEGHRILQSVFVNLMGQTGAYFEVGTLQTIHQL